MSKLKLQKITKCDFRTKNHLKSVLSLKKILSECLSVPSKLITKHKISKK